MRFKLSVLLNAPLLPFWPVRGIANRELDMIKDEMELPNGMEFMRQLWSSKMKVTTSTPSPSATRPTGTSTRSSTACPRLQEEDLRTTGAEVKHQDDINALALCDQADRNVYPILHRVYKRKISAPSAPAASS